MKTKVIISTKRDENHFIEAIEKWLYGTKVYLDHENFLVKRISDKKIVFPYRVKNNRLQAYREV